MYYWRIRSMTCNHAMKRNCLWKMRKKWFYISLKGQRECWSEGRKRNLTSKLSNCASGGCSSSSLASELFFLLLCIITDTIPMRWHSFFPSSFFKGNLLLLTTYTSNKRERGREIRSYFFLFFSAKENVRHGKMNIVQACKHDLS